MQKLGSRFMLLGLSLWAGSMLSLPAATFVFDFEEGAFGTNWINLSTGPDSSPDLGFTTAGEALQSGTYSMGPLPHGERDLAHDPLHVRSTAFTLDGSGDLSFGLKGGTTGVLAPDLGTGTISAGVQGIALRRVSDGERVLSAAATYQGTITTVTWTQASLAIYAAEVGETWTIDIYDTRSGGWGWFSVDNITIPGALIPEPGSMALAALGGLLLLRRRR